MDRQTDRGAESRGQIRGVTEKGRKEERMLGTGGVGGRQEGARWGDREGEGEGDRGGKRARVEGSPFIYSPSLSWHDDV